MQDQAKLILYAQIYIGAVLFILGYLIGVMVTQYISENEDEHLD